MESEIKVHTSLPPGVEGKIYSHLYLQVPYVIWEKKFRKDLQHEISVKVCWWGEKTDGAIFYPSVIYDQPHNNLSKTAAKYDICSDYKKFTAYLKDMEKLPLSVLSGKSVLGTAYVSNLCLLATNLQVSGLFPVISHTKKKIAELFVKIRMQKFVDAEEESVWGKSISCAEEKSFSFGLKRQNAIHEDHADNVQDNADLIEALLEKAEKLRQAMIRSLVENKNLEYVLENERRKLKDEEIKRNYLIENILGMPKNADQSLIATGDKITIADLHSSTSSTESRVNDLSESFDSIPDDAVINELFYNETNVGSAKQEDSFHNSTLPVSADSKKTTGPNKHAENKKVKFTTFHQLSLEKRLIIENIKIFKVKIKDLIFQVSKTASKTPPETSIQSLLQKNKPRTFIVEFISPFAVKVGLWDHKGHRKESTDLLTFISRQVKQRAVSFEQEVNIPFHTAVSADAVAEKELVFYAKARLHDVRKMIDLGNGSIKIKDCIAVGSSSLQCSVRLCNNIKIASILECKKQIYEIVQPLLQIEINLVLSELKHPVDKAVATSDDEFCVKENESITITQSIHGNGQPANKCDLILTEPLHCILQISEGKDFGEKKWLHLVCRLFFSKNAVFRDILYNPDEPTICFSQIFPILLNKELLKQTENNVMVIEVWERLKLSDQLQLKGLCKLPLHCFYLVFNNTALARGHLLSKYPIISTFGQTPVIHPVTGNYSGTFNILFALGTLQQIDNVLEEGVCKCDTFKASMTHLEPESNSAIKHVTIPKVKTFARVPHILEIMIEELGGLKISRNMVWGEAECYITYCFPTQENGEVKIHLYKSNSQLIMPDIRFKSMRRFVFFLNKEEELEDFLVKELLSENEEEILMDEKYPVKLWGNFYIPYQRTELLASTYLSLTDLCDVIRKAKTTEFPPHHHSFELAFQRSFANNCRVKVDYVTFTLTYWRHAEKEQISQSMALVNNIATTDENSGDSSSVKATDDNHNELSNSNLISKSDQYIREATTESDSFDVAATDAVIERKNNYFRDEDANIPERDDSSQSFSDRISFKIHETDELTTRQFPIPLSSQDNPSGEFCSISEDFTFNAHVVIERALYLPKISDNKSEDLAPSSYVIFNSDEKTEFTTNVVRNSCDPVWNWHHDITFSMAHPSLRNGVSLIFKVLHQRNDESNNPDTAKDKVIGGAVIELTPLLHGLNEIFGWYNITDRSGKCQGQIKISITPKKNEIFKQAHCRSMMQSDGNQQSSIIKKSSSTMLSQEIYNSALSCGTSIQKQLEELDLLHSQLMNRLAQLPAVNNIIDLPNLNNKSLLIKQSSNEGKNLDTRNVNNFLAYGTRGAYHSSTEDHKNDSDKGHSKTCHDSEKSIDYAVNSNALSCSVHFSSGKEPVFSGPVSPHKTVKYTTYIHSKCINDVSSSHDHKNGSNCDCCDKLEVINSTVEMIDLSSPFNFQSIVAASTNNFGMTEEHGSVEYIRKQTERTNDDKDRPPNVLTVQPSSVEMCGMDGSQHDQIEKEEGDTESSRDTLIESIKPV